MQISSPVSASQPACLTRLDSDTWVVENTKVSDSELLSLAHRPDLHIREVRAPLSSVSTETLTLFLQTHGSNLEKLNLQNNKIGGEAFANLAKMMPRLKTLSFQYLHEVKNEDILSIIQTCKELGSLRMSQNRGISKRVFYQILELDRDFSELSLDIFGLSKKDDHDGDMKMIKAQVKTLRLSGLSFGNNDVTNVAAIKGLRTVGFVLTSAKPEDVARLYTSAPPEERLIVEITDISKKNLAAFEEFFSKEKVPFSKRDIRGPSVNLWTLDLK
jgi:hypothetical protein